MINKKKEVGFYASKVRLFLNEYDGIPLEVFCKAYNIAPYKFFCDVLRLIKIGAGEIQSWKNVGDIINTILGKLA